MKKIKEGLKFLGASLVSAVVLVFLGIVFFGVTLWIIKTASDFFFGPGLEANWAVFSAAIMSIGAILAGTLEKKQ